MSTPSQVEAIFLAVLDIKTEAERSLYLDHACGDDAPLRNRVERLLKAHPQAVDFLARPAVEHLRVDSLDPAETSLGFAVSNLSAGADKASSVGPEVINTLADPHDDDEDNALAVLQPSKTLGSLGRLGHYEVLEVLGKGSFGTVVKAIDDKLRRFAAIKLMSTLLAATSAPRKRFLREARSAAAVRHQSVVAIYAVEDQPIPYLVMEYIAGQTLQEKLDKTGPLEVPEVLRLGRQIAEGLAAAHATGLIHRDIKPSNILLEQGVEQAKITDFGLARAVDDASLSRSGLIAGTPMYMAPEQALGEKIDHRADLFSLGSVLYVMCTGRPPFRAASTMAVLKRVTEDTPRPIREIIPEIPEWLCDLIARLQAKNPADRVASAQEVADLLAQHRAEPHPSVNVPRLSVVPPTAAENTVMLREVPESSPVIRRPRFRKHRWTAAAALLMILSGSLGFTEATGVTDVHSTVIRLFSPEGTLVVEVDDPGVSVKIDGSDIVIKGAGAKEIRLKPGHYTVEASKNGKLVRQELVNVARNGRQVVRVSQEAVPPVAKAATRSIDQSAWENVVASFSGVEQVKAVAARLKELNPGFDGAVVPTIENGVVRGLKFNSDDVEDISPVRVLTKLRSLKCSGSGYRSSPLMDLSPLSGLPLTTLVVTHGQLIDLTPLQGMPLTEFDCYETRVDDLSPLKGMKLRTLRCIDTSVSDLSPLKGMPLRTLYINHTKIEDLTALAGMNLVDLDIQGMKISDLSPLKGMKLTALTICSTPVSDLSPLAGMKLTYLHCGDGTPVSDLSPLNGMPLTHLICSGTKVSDESLAQLKDCKDLTLLILVGTQVSDAGLTHLRDLKNLRYLQLQGTKVSDLSPLKDMTLEEIRLTPKNITAQGLDILRNMKSLKSIGTHWTQVWPAEEFWTRYEKGEFKK